MRILVTDDVADSADSLAEVLSLHGHQVVAVHSGTEALECLEEWRPHLLICNLAMPEVTGLCVARQVRQRPDLDDVVLVAWSGYTSLEVREQAGEAGFQHFLPKPTEPVDLFALVQRIGVELPDV